MTVYHCNSLAVQALGNIKMLKMGDLEEYLGKKMVAVVNHPF